MFKPGDVVTDLNPRSYSHKKQGQVVNVQLCLWGPPEVLVCFFPEITDSPGFDYPDDEREYYLYAPEQLRLDPDWKAEVYAKRHFGTRWHSVNTLKAALDQKQPCMVEDCPESQQERVWINIWGTVYDVFVCRNHAKHYRYYSCMDSFPFRKTTA